MTWWPSTGADVDIDRFLATNQPAWDRLAELAARAGRGLDRLGAAELDELVRLYQRATTHLSYAQTYYRDPALTARLSRLVARAGAVLYGTRPRTLRAAGWFLAVTFPAAVWHARRFVLVSAVLFAVPALALGIWIANSPAAVDALGPAAAREAYVNEEFESYYRSEEATQFATEVFTNNIQVAFLAFAAGVLGCVLTGWLLVANGAALGEVAGLFAAVGQLPRFWGLILPHGLLELTAVFVAGGSGLALGWAWISPGDRPRLAALAEEGRRAVVIVLGLVLVFAVAGTIEGYVTGQPWPTWLRVGIGLLAEAAFVVYVVVLGRRAAARGFSGQIGEQERTGWSPGDGYSRPVALTLR
ncbi:MAG TPA: stage II sporulation protein M [Actinomycetes bacterium]|nr:stage II sporulation protein M [Actinomycetes bacterium]